MTITLTPEIEQVLTERAEKRGTTPELLALNDLRSLYIPDEPRKWDEQATLADVLAGRIGTIDSAARTGQTHSYLSEERV